MAELGIQLNGRENCSFSYNVPDEGLVKISGYVHHSVHVNKASRLYESAFRTWMRDDQWIRSSAGGLEMQFGVTYLGGGGM